MNKSEQLIACLEGEIAKRDARIVELESDLAGTQSRVLSLQDQWRKLDAELAALKAQDTVGEVVGWYRLDRPHEMTPYPSVCATWHKLGAPVAPLYAAPVSEAKAQGVVMPERLKPSRYEIQDARSDAWNSCLDEVARLNAAPAAPAADAWIPVSERLPGDQGHDSEEVLCFLNGHCSLLDNECRQGGGWGIRLGYYDADIGTFRVFGRPESHVTHWMPLPAAPIKIEASRHDQ